METENLEKYTRNAVRAVIIRDRKLLVQKKLDGSFTIPGGAPQADETLEQGLIRECNEEIGTQVIVKELVYVADYFKPRESTPPTIRHQIEFLFICSVDKTYKAKNGPSPDKRQVDVQWIGFDNLEQQRFVPASLIEPIKQLNNHYDKNLPTYLGIVK
ncbi:MAG: NUDIX domain-containing protein [Pseudomonadota bacterium]